MTPRKPERITIAEALPITGLSRRAMQALAARGEIPGAAKLGKLWSFNEVRLREWITEREENTRRMADRGPREKVSFAPAPARNAPEIEALYRAALRGETYRC